MSERMKELPEAQRPYEKCLFSGENSLSDVELLAVLLRSGTREKSVISLAAEILSLTNETPFPGLPGLLHLSVQDLMRIPGMGKVKSIQVKCAGELCRRMSCASAKSHVSYHDPESIARYYMEKLRHEEQEMVYLMMLDIRNHFLGEQLMSRGTADGSMITPREVLIEALKRRASGIVLVHNHPSGDAAPSVCDEEMTKRVKMACETVGIPLLDHIVIGDHTFFSFREMGLITENDI